MAVVPFFQVATTKTLEKSCSEFCDYFESLHSFLYTHKHEDTIAMQDEYDELTDPLYKTETRFTSAVTSGGVRVE